MPCLSLSSYFKPNLLRGETSDSRLVAVADRNFPNGLYAECTKKTSLKPKTTDSRQALTLTRLCVLHKALVFFFLFLFPILNGIVKGFNTMWLSIST